MAERKRGKTDYGMTEGWVSLAVNILLFALKYIAGIMSGSIAIIADAWHTISDSLTSLIVLIGTSISKKPADKQHPFGHGRAKFIGSIIIGVFLAVVGFDILVGSIERIKIPEKVTMGLLPILVIAFSVVMKEALAQFAFWAGRRENNPSVISDGWHHRSDAITSLVVLIGLWAGKDLWWIDPVLGIGISLFLFYTAYRIIVDSASPLLGEKPDDELMEKIRKISRSVYEGDLRAHHFHVHNYGDHQEMTFHIVLPKEMRLSEAYRITGELFNRIREELDIIATIHIDTKSKH